MNREDLIAIPQAAAGLAVSVANYYVGPVLRDVSRAATFVTSRLAIRAWSEMPGNPNQEPTDYHQRIGSMATIHYYRTPERPEDQAA